MKLAPSSNNPPFAYAQSQLNKPTDTSFAYFVSRIRRFRKASIISTGTAIMWHIVYNFPKLSPKNRDQTEIFITRAYASKVIALAAIFCSAEGRPDAGEIDFRLLCWEFHQIDEFFTNSEWIIEVEIPDIQRAIQVLPQSSLVKKIPLSEAREVIYDLMRGRLLRDQWLGHSYHNSDWIRTSSIYKEFRRLVNQIPVKEFDVFEGKLLGTSFDRFLQAGFGLFSIFLGEMKNERAGWFQLKSINFDEPIKENIDINAGDFKIVATRLALKLSDFSSFRREIELLPEEMKKRANALEVFDAHPLIDMEEDSDGLGLVVSPSPEKLQWAVVDYLMHDFFKSLMEHSEKELMNRNPYSLRGEAFENYLRSALASTALIEVNPLPTYKGKIPDFIWLGEQWGIIIEAKFSLKPNSDRNYNSASTLIETWRRASEAIEQGIEFLNDGVKKFVMGEKPIRWILIIVTNEPLAEESISFKAACKRWNFLDGSKISSFAVLTAAELEFQAMKNMPDQLAMDIQKVWDELDPSALNQTLRSFSNHSEFHKTEFSHLRSEWDRLFPGIKILRPND